MNEDLHDLDPDEKRDAKREEALDDAGRTHYFQGRKLEQFSFGRQTAAQRLELSGESAMESAALIIFLCTLGEGPWNDETDETGIDRIDRARGPAEIKEFRRDMEKWAERCGIRLRSKAAKEAVKVANEIWAEKIASEAEPEIETSGKKKPE